jgi:hypothetical protein
MLEFNTRRLKFKFDGQEYGVDYPNVKKVMAFQKSTKGKEETDTEDVFTFLEDLGLERSVMDRLEVGHVTTIMNKLTETAAK